ncbi:nuclear transport factor 2 family protein [Xylanimonas sp. McL0601]|uniref:nuclear transport factor 2 family protein n=1 Tax=Xylanimonas sp. McL0601 TaxID=3414739 RepID=UPI003CEA6351
MNTMNTTSPGQVVTGFVATFASKDPARLAPFLAPGVEFEAYGERPVVGRDAVLMTWGGVFANFERVEFSTLHQAVTGDVVLEEQVHGLALPGRHLAPIRNVAVYRVRDGQIVEWRDYTDSQHARTLL